MIIAKIKMWRQSFNDNGKDWVYLGPPLLISLITKLILLVVLYSTPINNDGTLYINAAKQYAMGNFVEGLSLYPMPAYPLLLAFIHIVISDWIISGFFVSTISIILAIIPLYYLTKTMFGNKAGFWACLVFSFLPKMNVWSMYISRDPVFLFLFSLCVYFALKSIMERNYSLFGATFITAWSATLIRIEGVIFIGFYFCVLICLAFTDKEKRAHYFSRALIWAGIPLCVVLLALLSSGVRGMAVNRFDYVLSELKFFLTGDFLIRPAQIYHYFSEIADHPPPFFGHYNYRFVELCKHFLPIIYMLGIVQVLLKVLFPLSVIPLYLGFKSRVKPSTVSVKFIFWLWVLFIGLSYYFLLKMDFIATRYLMVPAFLLLPWIGHGLVRLYEKANASSKKAMIIALILIIILAPAAKTYKLVFSRDTIVVNTAKWLKDNDKISKVQIVSNNPRDAFYIDLEAEDDSSWKTHFYNKKKHKGLQNIEEFALEKNAQIIVFKTKSSAQIEAFQFYQKINSFVGNKYTIFIYKRISEK